MSAELDLFLHCKLPIDSQDACTQYYLRAMEQLIVVVQELSLARSLERIMEIVRVAARELTNSDGATFVLRDNGYCYYADEDAIAPLWKGQRFPMSICIGGWVMRNRQPVVIADVYGDERIPFAAYQPTFIKSMVMVPIRMLDPIGSIGIYWAMYHQPKPEEVKLLQALADTTAVAMENVQVYSQLQQRVCDRTAALESANIRLQNEIHEREKAEAEVHRLSLTDELTGLYNRRGFFLLVEQQLKQVQRSQTPASLMFIDLDGLKVINDLLGHEIGDAAIIAAATLLKQTFRVSDIVARLGGDEFVVLMQGSDPSSQAIQQRLQAAIAQFNQKKQQFHLSMSIGVQSYDHTQPVSLDKLITLADAQMYQVKRTKQGRR